MVRIRKFKAPDPDDLIAEHDGLGIKLYAHLSECLRFANARLIAPKRNVFGRRQSFWFGFVIAEQRLAHARDSVLLQPALRAWVEAQMREHYGAEYMKADARKAQEGTLDSLK